MYKLQGRWLVTAQSRRRLVQWDGNNCGRRAWQCRWWRHCRWLWWPKGIKQVDAHKEPLESVVHKLATREYDPMSDNLFIPRVARARARHHFKHGSETTRYYTMDHRQGWRMLNAGCTKIRVEIEMDSALYDKSAKKANNLGKPINELTRVKSVISGWINLKA